MTTNMQPIVTSAEEIACFICSFPLKVKSTRFVTSETLKKLQDASSRRHDDKREGFKEGMELHVSCLIDYPLEKLIKAELKRQQAATSQLQQQQNDAQRFDYDTCCLFCGKLATKKHRDRVSIISKMDTMVTIRNLLEKNPSHAYSDSLKARMDDDKDLVEAKARYHKHCMSNYWRASTPRSGKRKGRFSDSCEKFTYFVIVYVSSHPDEFQYSIEDLKNEYSKEYANEDIDFPSNGSIKNQLLRVFADKNIIFVRNVGDLVFSFEDKINSILRDHYLKHGAVTAEQREREILHYASDLIFRDIKRQNYDTTNYNPPSEFFANVESDIPSSLKTLLDRVVKRNKELKTAEQQKKWNNKVSTIAHSIISAVRPRTFISSILLSLSLMLHWNHCGKRAIVTFSNLGFCAPYYETVTFENSIANDPENFKILLDAFLQFAGDNFDLIRATVDGHDSCHKLGSVQCVTPASAVTSLRKIVRSTKLRSDELVKNCSFIPYVTLESKKPDGLKSLRIIKLPEEFKEFFKRTDIGGGTTLMNLFWSYCKNLKPTEIDGWHGFMTKCFQHYPFTVSRVIPLQFVNENPSDINSVYSFLLEAVRKCKMNGQRYCFVTFDQPLYAKAVEIMASLPDDHDIKRMVILRLGGFHLVMSFLGATGVIMDCSGLKEVFCEFFAESSAINALNGKAYSRAVRGHFLVQLGLSSIVFSMIDLDMNDTEKLRDLLGKVGDFDFTMDDESILLLREKYTKKLEELKSRGPTAQLWVQLIHMQTLLQNYIAAERSGDWELHLKTVSEMLPYFHAAGHLHYAKYGHIYLQTMLRLKEIMKDAPEEYKKFVKEAFFTIRRSHKFWCGSWVDLVIEQMLMKNLKSRSGVVDRGLNESTLSKWSANQVAISAIMNGLEEFSGASYVSSEQHVEMRDSRKKKDAADMMKIIQFFTEHNPFPVSDEIMSISSNIVGDKSLINCYQAYEVGKKLFDKMDGTFGDLKFPRSNKIKSLKAVVSQVKIDGEMIEIDPLLIFTRMTAAMFTGKGDLETYMLYELCTYPASLFSEKGMIDSRKSRFSDEFHSSSEIPADACYIIDGGYLLHKVVWKCYQSVRDILGQYVGYVMNRYKSDETWVVFDGYPHDCSDSTKSYQRHQRHATVCAEIQITLDTKINSKQSVFLSNERNKERLIQLLSEELRIRNIMVTIAEEDADLLIIETAMHVARARPNNNILVVGEDVDLLVIMNELAPLMTNVYFFQPKRSNAKKDNRIYSSRSFKYPHLQNRVGLLHSFSGCDTTSGFYGQGKSKLTVMMNKFEILRPLMDCFYEENAEPLQITSNGCKIVASMYGANSDKSLQQVRFSNYCESSASKTFNLKMLPPTEGAVQQHSYRTYHQLQSWLGNKKRALDWGWSKLHYGLKPCMITDKKFLIPEDILRDFFCSCRSGCKNNACGCKKRGLKCSSLCRVCVGKDCANCDEDREIESDDDETCNNDYAIDYDETIESVVNNVEYGYPCGHQQTNALRDEEDECYHGVDECIGPRDRPDNFVEVSRSEPYVYEEIAETEYCEDIILSTKERSQRISCSCRSGCKTNACGCVQRQEKCSLLCRYCIKKGCMNRDDIDVSQDEVEENLVSTENHTKNNYDESIEAVVKGIDDETCDNEYAIDHNETIEAVVNNVEHGYPCGHQQTNALRDEEDECYHGVDECIGPRDRLDNFVEVSRSEPYLYEEIAETEYCEDIILSTKEISQRISCSCRSGCKTNVCGCVQRQEKCSLLCRYCVKKGCMNRGYIDVSQDEVEENLVSTENYTKNNYDESIEAVVKDIEYDCDIENEWANATDHEEDVSRDVENIYHPNTNAERCRMNQPILGERTNSLSFGFMNDIKDLRCDDVTDVIEIKRRRIE